MGAIDELPRSISLLGLNINLEKIHLARDFVREISPDKLERAESVLTYLVDLGPDTDAIVAGLLFSARVDTEKYREKIETLFGSAASKLLVSLEKIRNLRADISRNDMEVLRQVILMMAKDIRVMLIRLADRLHEMHVLEELSPAEQRRIAEESLKIYAPVASRLGMYSIKWQLEDLAFATLNPTQFTSIRDQLQQIGTERREVLDEFQKDIISFLHGKGISCRVSSRTKSIYSIYRKMRRKSTDQIYDLHDIFAIRIVLPTIIADERELTEALYSTLGLIHNRWTPIPGRFKDYVAVPKPNGYQSLHTAIFTSIAGLKNQPVEIQIRSEQMHREAEYGIAAHWLYEDTRGVSTKYDKSNIVNLIEGSKDTQDVDMQNKRLKRQIEWLRGLIHVQEHDEYKDEHHQQHELNHDYKIDIFHDRIFVFTPNGEVKDLPSGSTPVDFAYNIHTDIGNRCAMVRVNGTIVPLNYTLKNGDVVEVVLKPKPNPRSEWLSFVKTPSARHKIKIWFKSQNKELSLREGRELMNKHLRRLNKAGLDDQMSVLKVYGGKQLSVSERQKIVEGVGSGSIPVHTVMKKLFSQEDLIQPMTPVPLKMISDTMPIEKRILLGGEAGLPVRIAACCQPKEGERIAGYVTRQHASIHRVDCNHLQKSNPARILDARWVSGQPGAQKYSVRVVVEAVNRIGLIRDVTGVVADMNVNILDFSLKNQDEKFVVRSLLLEVEGYEQLDEILRRLESITGVVHVMREESREHRGISGSKMIAHPKVSEE